MNKRNNLLVALVYVTISNAVMAEFTPFDSKFDPSGLSPTIGSAPGTDLPLMLGYATRQALSFRDLGKKRGAAEASIYQKISAGTVLIVTDDGIGSGALITDTGYIVTNQHVVGDAKAVKIFFKPVGRDNDPRKAVEVAGRVTKINWQHDLALVKVDSMPSHARPIPVKRDAAPAIGEDAHAVGHPRGEVWSYTRGYVSQYRSGYKWSTDGNDEGRQADVVQTQTPINPGNSGGPLVNADGLLIGLNSFGDPKSPGLNFAVASSTIFAFLQQNGSVGKPKKVSKKDCGREPLGEKRTKIKNGFATSVFYDPGCKGRATLEKIIPDDESLGIALILHDPESDDKSVVMLLDKNRDGTIDLTYVDEDGDGTWDLVGTNQPGETFASDLKPARRG